MEQAWFVYMLLCDEKTFYIGITNNLIERLQEHRSGDSFFTKKFSRIEVVYCEKYSTKHQAVLREKQIKGWSRSKKQMLIDGKLGHNVCTELAEVLRILKLVRTFFAACGGESKPP